MFIFFSLLFKKVQKVYCSTFTAYCSLFKKTHCHSIVIHSHTIVSICNAVRKQLCDHCINYCVTIVIIVHCLQVFLQSCFLNLVFSILFYQSCFFNLVFSILFYQSCFINLVLSILSSQSCPLNLLLISMYFYIFLCFWFLVNEVSMCFYLFQFISVLHFYFMSSPKNINWLKVTTYFHIVIFHLVNKLFSNINITINSENNFLLISN